MLTRRRLLEGTGAVTAATIIGRHAANAQAQPYETPLPIPELRDARALKGAIQLSAALGRTAIMPGKPTRTYGFSAPYLGPVLRLYNGDEVEITVENKLDRDTTAHWHGVLLPGALDGGPHVVIKPNSTWRPVLKIDQPETTAWYHAHPHYDTARQVYMGLASLIIIEDGSSQRLGLPRSYGTDDLPVILQDRQLDPNGTLVYNVFGPSRMLGFRGDTLTVNGAIAPVAKVPPGLVRLRLLNGANARNFDLRFTDGRTFHVIASDGGYLAAPVAMTSLMISPGERFEVLVDFSDGRSVILETGSDNPFLSGAGRAVVGEIFGSARGRLLRFEVDHTRVASAKKLPTTLATQVAPDLNNVRRRRELSLDMGPTMRGRGGPFGINGRAYDMHRIDFEAPLGTSEIWTVTPRIMAHPFHVHGVIFRVLSLGGKPPPPHLAAGKDTLLLNMPAELLLTFTQPATTEFPFMFHCHILEHEDEGLMGQFRTT